MSWVFSYLRLLSLLVLFDIILPLEDTKLVRERPFSRAVKSFWGERDS